MMAYAAQARRRGVRILEGVQAMGLQIRSGQVKEVTTTDGDIGCEWVVNAAGARAREVAAWADLNLPITIIKRHIMVTGPVATYSQHIPFTYEVDPTWYMRREGPGLLLGMGSAEIEAVGDKALDERVDGEVIAQLIDYSVYRAPALQDAGLMTRWAGLRPATPDEAPILGPVPHLRGYLNDCGWGGNGVMNAPAAGRALAELITEGRTSEVDIRPYSASRFASAQEGS
jgi:sarcosine oxidase subunit beta